MPGILRQEQGQEGRESQDFDRKQVLKNTELNAQLGTEGERIREQLKHAKPSESSESDESPRAPQKKSFPKTKAPTALTAGDDVGFDEDNIRDWDEQRGKTQKILEPNTPYMGTAADTEYYDEDPVPDLDLGGSA